MKDKYKGKSIDFLRSPSFSTLLILVLMIAIAAMLQPTFFKLQTLTSYINTFAPLILLSFGQAIAMFGGGMDQSLGNAMALMLCVMTRVMDKNNPITGLYAILLGAAVALCVGIVNGIAVGYFRLSPFIATYATSQIWIGIALLVMPKPGGQIVPWFRAFYNLRLVKGLPEWVVSINNFLPPVVILILLLCLMWAIIRKTKTGRYIAAVGSNFDNSYFRGINASLVQMKAYILAAFCAFVCALFYAGQNGAGNAHLGEFQTLQSVAAALVGGIAITGGKGNVYMSIAGAVIMGLVGRIIYFAEISSNYQMLASGVIIIAAIASSAMYSGLRKKAMLREVKKNAAGK